MCCGNKPKLDGNLLHLERYQDNANTPQATLDFSYIGPKRVGYAYDTNGNITYDPLRCFDIRYNLLNLASEVISHDPEESADSTTASEDDGTAAANETSDGVLLSETVYYADGTRAGVKTPDDGYWTTRYIGSLIYEGEPGQETLEGVITDNGFIQWNGSAANSRMQYFLRDHLGSVRVIAEDRHTVISRTDYLPFGVRMSGDGLTTGNATGRSSWYGFSGKENEMWGGYDTADGDTTPHWLKGERYQHFGARAYDPVSCIFMQVDPMAEKYYGMTPYGYCAGNPVMMVDPDGAWIEIQYGESLYRYDSGSLYRYNKSTALFEECDIQSGSFVEIVFVSILQLLNSDTGADLVSFFNNDENNVRIHPGETPDANNVMENSTKIVLNPLGSGSKIPTEIGIDESPLWLDLGHELAHRKDFIERGYDVATQPWLSASIKDTEKVATHYENMIRQEMGLPLRTHYACETSDTTIMQAHEPSRLIKRNGKSLFFPGVSYIPYKKRTF